VSVCDARAKAFALAISQPKGLLMKNHFRLTASLLALAASFTLAAGAQAQTAAPSHTGMYNAGGSYADLNVGQSDFSLDNGLNAFDSNEGDTTYGVRIGSYFNENLGVELGYTDFGSVNRGGGNTRARGINLSLVGKLPLSPAFNLLGKIGTTYSDTDVSAAPVGVSGIVSGSETGFGLSYGVGVEYAFNPKWSATLQYESQDLKFAGDRNERIGVTSLGVRYHF
jgi:opacity protein-like surface antigen